MLNPFPAPASNPYPPFVGATAGEQSSVLFVRYATLDASGFTIVNSGRTAGAIPGPPFFDYPGPPRTGCCGAGS